MADNPQKRALINRAMMILNAGRTAAATTMFTSITDAEFADYSAITDEEKRVWVFNYERILKQVLLDMQPDFACSYADLSDPVGVNQADGGWDYLFELPSDFLSLIKQCSEGDPSDCYDCELLFLKGYAHTVIGSDEDVYYCDTAHTSVDDSTDGQPPTDDGAGNWTLDSTDELEGAEWVEGVSYKASGTGYLLATNDLTNEAGDSAYIRYIAYVQTTNGGTAGRSDQPAYYPEAFCNAFATRLAAEMCIDSKDYERRRRLLEEYESLAKPASWAAENRYKARVRAKTVFERRTSS